MTAIVAAAAALSLLTALAITFVYLHSGDRDEPNESALISPAPSTTPIEESTAPPSPTPPPPEFDPDAFEIPAGFLGVRSIGALTREPDGFEEFAGPGAATQLAVDAHSYKYSTTEDWRSEVHVGVFNANGILFDTDNLEGTAEAALEAWAYGSGFDSVSGVTIDWVGTEQIPIDGKTGAITSALLQWDTTDYTDETMEAVQVLLVEIDKTTGWIGLASVAGSHFDSHYEAATFALINTTFAV